jgi:hypothetical protein
MNGDRSDATTGPAVPRQRGVRDHDRAEAALRHVLLTTDTAPRSGHVPLHLRIPQQRAPLPT